MTYNFFVHYWSNTLQRYVSDLKRFNSFGKARKFAIGERDRLYTHTKVSMVKKGTDGFPVECDVAYFEYTGE